MIHSKLISVADPGRTIDIRAHSEPTNAFRILKEWFNYKLRYAGLDVCPGRHYRSIPGILFIVVPNLRAMLHNESPRRTR